MSIFILVPVKQVNRTVNRAVCHLVAPQASVFVLFNSSFVTVNQVNWVPHDKSSSKMQLHGRQYLYFCTSKASKLRSKLSTPRQKRHWEWCWGAVQRLPASACSAAVSICTIVPVKQVNWVSEMFRRMPTPACSVFVFFYQKRSKVNTCQTSACTLSSAVSRLCVCVCVCVLRLY